MRSNTCTRLVWVGCVPSHLMHNRVCVKIAKQFPNALRGNFEIRTISNRMVNVYSIYSLRCLESTHFIFPCEWSNSNGNGDAEVKMLNNDALVVVMADGGGTRSVYLTVRFSCVKSVVIHCDKQLDMQMLECASHHHIAVNRTPGLFRSEDRKIPDFIVVHFHIGYVNC